jgi:hypothetical protein
VSPVDLITALRARNPAHDGPLGVAHWRLVDDAVTGQGGFLAGEALVARALEAVALLRDGVDPASDLVEAGLGGQRTGTPVHRDARRRTEAPAQVLAFAIGRGLPIGLRRDGLVASFAPLTHGTPPPVFQATGRAPRPPAQALGP